MIRALFAYIFVFSAGLACAAAYFYSLHPEHTPEDDMPKMRVDLEDVLERAKRARDAFEAPPPPPEKVPAKPAKTADASQVNSKNKPKR